MTTNKLAGGWRRAFSVAHTLLPHATEAQQAAVALGVAGSRALHPDSTLKSSRQMHPSPWALQFSSRLSSSGQCVLAAQAQAQEALFDSDMVEEWLQQLVTLKDADARAQAEALLSRHPHLLWHPSPSRVTRTVQVLSEAIRERGLMRQWFFNDRTVLQLCDRYQPDALRKRLAVMHASVWEHLDDEATVVLAFQAGRASLDLLDLDARALAAKAHKLRCLVPHFMPSTLLRALPELQDIEPEEINRSVQRAGLVVALGHPTLAGRVALRVTPNGMVNVVAESPVNLYAKKGLGLRSYDDLCCEQEAADDVVLMTLPNLRTIVYVNEDMSCDTRFEAADAAHLTAASAAYASSLARHRSQAAFATA